MKTLLRSPSLVTAVVYYSLVFFGLMEFAEGSDAAPPGLAEMPGLTVEDRFPRGCVDCHINMPQINQDERLSSVMSNWTLQVPPEILKKTRLVVGNDKPLKGRHPRSDQMFQAIPRNCLNCHENGSGSIVPIIPLIHLIHLSGGEKNHYLSLFEGQCTHCHKLEPNTGTMTVPIADEL